MEDCGSDESRKHQAEQHESSQFKLQPFFSPNGIDEVDEEEREEARVVKEAPKDEGPDVVYRTQESCEDDSGSICGLHRGQIQVCESCNRQPVRVIIHVGTYCIPEGV